MQPKEMTENAQSGLVGSNGERLIRVPEVGPQFFVVDIEVGE